MATHPNVMGLPRPKTHSTHRNRMGLIEADTHGYTHNIHSKSIKKTIFNNGRYTANIPTYPHTVTTTDIQTYMRHIHTSIVSRHLATRGNKKYCTHLHHTLTAHERYFPASLVASLPKSEQINHPS